MLQKIIKSILQATVKYLEDYSALCLDAESLLPVQYYHDLSEVYCGQTLHAE